jgi:hypothetical protein
MARGDLNIKSSFFRPSPLSLGVSTGLRLTRGPAANRTTTGNLSATQECRDTNWATRTTSLRGWCTMRSGDNVLWTPIRLGCRDGNGHAITFVLYIVVINCFLWPGTILGTWCPIGIASLLVALEVFDIWCLVHCVHLHTWKLNLDTILRLGLFVSIVCLPYLVILHRVVIWWFHRNHTVFTGNDVM